MARKNVDRGSKTSTQNSGDSMKQNRGSKISTPNVENTMPNAQNRVDQTAHKKGSKMPKAHKIVASNPAEWTHKKVSKKTVAAAAKALVHKIVDEAGAYTPPMIRTESGDKPIRTFSGFAPSESPDEHKIVRALDQRKLDAQMNAVLTFTKVVPDRDAEHQATLKRAKARDKRDGKLASSLGMTLAEYREHKVVVAQRRVDTRTDQREALRASVLAPFLSASQLPKVWNAKQHRFVADPKAMEVNQEIINRLVWPGDGTVPHPILCRAARVALAIANQWQGRGRSRKLRHKYAPQNRAGLDPRDVLIRTKVRDGENVWTGAPSETRTQPRVTLSKKAYNESVLMMVQDASELFQEICVGLGFAIKPHRIHSNEAERLELLEIIEGTKSWDECLRKCVRRAARRYQRFVRVADSQGNSMRSGWVHTDSGAKVFAVGTPRKTDQKRRRTRKTVFTHKNVAEIDSRLQCRKTRTPLEILETRERVAQVWATAEKLGLTYQQATTMMRHTHGEADNNHQWRGLGRTKQNLRCGVSRQNLMYHKAKLTEAMAEYDAHINPA